MKRNFYWIENKLYGRAYYVNLGKMGSTTEYLGRITKSVDKTYRFKQSIWMAKGSEDILREAIKKIDKIKNKQ